MIEHDEKVIEEISKHFETLCQENRMEFRVHKHACFRALSELATETRFADVLIIGSELFYENIDRANPTIT
jgi:hypothetical protein